MAPLRFAYPDEHHYPADSVHVTLSNLDAAACAPADLVHAVTEATQDSGRLRLFFIRPAISRGTIYLAGADTTGHLRRLRQGLRSTTDLPPTPLSWVRDDLVFVNVVRFQTPMPRLRLSRDLRHLILPEPLQGDVRTAELVRTDKVLSGVGTDTLAVLPLARTQAG